MGMIVFMNLCWCSVTGLVWHTCTRTQVFFLKANYVGGELKLNKDELVDYIWVTKNEMKNYVSQEFYNTLSVVLPDWSIVMILLNSIYQSINFMLYTCSRYNNYIITAKESVYIETEYGVTNRMKWYNYV